MEEARRHVNEFLSSEFQNIDVTRVMLGGDPASVIVDYIAQKGVDLVMLPTHGFGPFRRFPLGSVAAKVLHDAKCSVWTSVHLPAIPALPAIYRNVLCALNLKPDSLALLRWASEFASENGATLTLAHALPGFCRWESTSRAGRHGCPCSIWPATKWQSCNGKPALRIKWRSKWTTRRLGSKSPAKRSRRSHYYRPRQGRNEPLGRLRSHILHAIVRERFVSGDCSTRSGTISRRGAGKPRFRPTSKLVNFILTEEQPSADRLLARNSGSSVA